MSFGFTYTIFNVLYLDVRAQKSSLVQKSPAFVKHICFVVNPVITVLTEITQTVIDNMSDHKF